MELLTNLDAKLLHSASKIGSCLHLQPQEVPEKTVHLNPKTVVAKKFRYAVLKGCLNKAITEMELWQKLFDPTWFLLARTTARHIEEELLQETQDDKSKDILLGIREILKVRPQHATSIFLPVDGLDQARVQAVPFSSVKLVQRVGSGSWLLVDAIAVDPQQSISQRKQIVRDLATRLSRADPVKLGLLTSVGAIDKRDTDEFEIVFKIPPSMSDPATLRSKLLAAGSNHSLSDRFRLAVQVATAVCSIHTFGLVHKNIRPENIIVFEDGTSTLGSAFLVGFEAIRSEAGHTRLVGDVCWEKNIYRHPRRQGLKLHDVHVMQHDIYSLGVCLVEIGLWRSFVMSTESGKAKKSPHFVFDAGNPEFSKGRLHALAKHELPKYMGSKYARIVHTCLSCLDPGNEGFGDDSEFQDQDGVRVAVRYIEKVGRCAQITSTK